MDFLNAEILGIIATLFVLASFALSGEGKIRSINIIGSTLFVIYGIFIGAISVWLLNGALIFIHIYKLIKIKNAKSKEQSLE
ncbi:MAG: lactate dehydrogenase [Oscillospiraceae bacterium]|nr:lactate dehydrogenase [Oscillospiraceae bacterium]